MTEIHDNLTITLREIKNFLRIQDYIIAVVSQEIINPSTTIIVDTAMQLRVGDTVTFGSSLRKVIGIDYATNTLTLDSAIANISANYPIDGNSENEFLIDLISSVKTMADKFVNGYDFKNELGQVVIPDDIKIWCMRTVARYYEQRVNGLTSQSITDVGTQKFGSIDWYEEIYKYRNLAGMA